MTVQLPEYPDSCWPVDTSCFPDWDAWEVEPDPETGEGGVPLYSDNDKARAVALAGQTLRVLTGYRVGGCPVTVRPASRGCQEQTWRTYPVGGAGSVPWQPVYTGGEWLNIGCGMHLSACGCTGAREIRLGYAGAVTEVKMDGVVLDPSVYRLDPGGTLIRVDGMDWPLCQDMSLPDTEPGTWSVTYTPGVPVDGLGAWAAGLLAAQYVQACKTGQCDLPDTVSQVVREGVTLTFTPGAFPNGLTGIREVDAWITRWNPNKLAAPSGVLSRDVPRHRRVF